MNLREIANAATSAINPNATVVVYSSTGYTVGDDGTQVPTYAAAVTLQGQVQALRADELDQLNGLNLVGVVRKLYMSKKLDSVNRPEAKGGDLVIIGGKTWKVVLVFEAWPDWSTVAINEQLP